MNYDEFEYNGKHFRVPLFDAAIRPVILKANPQAVLTPIPNGTQSAIIACLNTPYDYAQFLVPRKPISLGLVPDEYRSIFSEPGVPRTLDLPIKFPGIQEIKLPHELAQFGDAIQRALNYEAVINRKIDKYYAYLTIDQGLVKKDTLQREAPCHVDGFQGARWQPKVEVNHTYTLGDGLPTVYYPQAFDVRHLDPARHDFFWEFNKIVADTNSKHAWQPQPWEITMMDGYTVHRGTEAPEETFRTWLRLSWEVRQFDRLGNAYNPHFQYNWNMVPRDIEALRLTAFDQEMDSSLRVFPHQGLDGKPLPAGQKTKPNLKPYG